LWSKITCIGPKRKEGVEIEREPFLYLLKGEGAIVISELMPVNTIPERTLSSIKEG